MRVFDPVDDLHLQAISEQRRGIAKIWGWSCSRGMLWQFVHVGDFIFQCDPCQFFLQVVTLEGVKSILQPNDKQSANMQVHTLQ